MFNPKGICKGLRRTSDRFSTLSIFFLQKNILCLNHYVVADFLKQFSNKNFHIVYSIKYKLLTKSSLTNIYDGL